MKKFYWRKSLPVNPYRHTLFKIYVNVGRLVWSFIGGNCHLKHIFRWFSPRVFKYSTLVAYMKQVPIAAIGFFFSYGNGNPMTFCIGHKILSRFKIPLTPRSYNANSWVKRIVG